MLHFFNQWVKVPRYLTYITAKVCPLSFHKDTALHPGQVPQLAGVLSWTPKGCRFDPWSGHVWKATDWCFSLSKINKHILGWGFKKKKKTAFQTVVCKHGHGHIWKPVSKTFPPALVVIITTERVMLLRPFLRWKGPGSAFVQPPGAVRQLRPRAGSGAHSLFNVRSLVLMDPLVSLGEELSSLWISWCQITSFPQLNSGENDSHSKKGVKKVNAVKYAKRGFWVKRGVGGWNIIPYILVDLWEYLGLTPVF